MITKLEAEKKEIASSVRLNHHNAWRDYRLARTMGLFATGLSASALEVASRSQPEQLSQGLIAMTLVGMLGGMLSLSKHWQSGFDNRQSVIDTTAVSDLREALPDEITPHAIGHQMLRLDMNIKDFTDFEIPGSITTDTVEAARNIRDWYRHGMQQNRQKELYGIAQIVAEIMEISQVPSDTADEDLAVDIEQKLAPYYEVLDTYLPLAPDTESWQKYFSEVRLNVTDTRTIERLIEPVLGRSLAPQSV